jgi:uncharacterized membrane protein YsdA (DUF1294 family)
MSLLNQMDTVTRISESRSETTWQQMNQYAICAVLGLVGGAVGVMLALGLAIIAQLALPSLILGVVPIALVAVLLGLASSWFFHKTMQRIFSYHFILRSLQITFIVSALTSILQTIVFI